MGSEILLLGVDGGGTGCRARLTDAAGMLLGEGKAGPANVRISLDESLQSVLGAARQCLAKAGATLDDPVVACLALAGASEPGDAAAAYTAFRDFFHRVVITTDARAACVGAHAGRDGGIIIVGTGTIGWALHGHREHRVGGWGFPVSDEGGGAWLGCEAVRRVLWAHDGRAAWTPLLREVSEELGVAPAAIVRWMGRSKPRDFGRLAPLIVQHAARKDPAACELMRLAGSHIDAIASRLIEDGAPRLALMGGLARAIEPWLSPEIRMRLVPPSGNALNGALRMACEAAGLDAGGVSHLDATSVQKYERPAKRSDAVTSGADSA